MAELLAVAWGALSLDRAAFLRWPAQRRLFGGLALFATIALLAGFGEAAAWTRARLSQHALQERRGRIVEAVDEVLSRSIAPSDAQSELVRNLSFWLELQNDLDAAQRPLGRPLSLALAGLQRAVAAPYRRLAIWLPYALTVFALAKALGGRAGLAEMLGATALSAVPHLLDVLRPLPWLGPLAGLVATAWGAAIFVRATQVSNGLGPGRALLAAALPALLALSVTMGALGILRVMW